MWGTGNTIQRTVEVIARIAQRVAAFENDLTTSETVVGLELLNEAMPGLVEGGLQTIQDFYVQGYIAARQYLPPARYAIIIEMAFTVDWGDFMTGPEYENVILDMVLFF
jgi:hypothetical protein